jgi:hypothetical protein
MLIPRRWIDTKEHGNDRGTQQARQTRQLGAQPRGVRLIIKVVSWLGRKTMSAIPVVASLPGFRPGLRARLSVRVECSTRCGKSRRRRRKGCAISHGRICCAHSRRRSSPPLRSSAGGWSVRRKTTMMYIMIKVDRCIGQCHRPDATLIGSSLAENDMYMSRVRLRRLPTSTFSW